MSRVLVLATWYPSADQPTMAVFNRQHVEVLARDHQVQVFHVRLLSTAPPRDEREGTVTVHRRSLHPAHPVAVWRLLQELRAYARGADYVHTMAFSAALVAALVWPHPAWVHTEHWNGVRDPGSQPVIWRAMAWLRHVLRLADCVTGVTDELTAILARFSAPGATRTVPCVVASAARVEPLPRGPGLDMVATGLLIERKDPVLAVRVLRQLRDDGIDARLTWIGTGPLRDEVAATAELLQVSPFLRLTGALPQDQVLVELARAQVFFLPTRYENFLVSAAEALAAGRPVVVGANGGHSEYMSGPGCELVATQEVGAYAAALTRIHRRLTRGEIDPDDLAGMVRARFGPDAVARAMREAYRVADRRLGWHPGVRRPGPHR